MFYYFFIIIRLIITFESILVLDISFINFKPSGFLRLKLMENIFEKRLLIIHGNVEFSGVDKIRSLRIV